MISYLAQILHLLNSGKLRSLKTFRWGSNTWIWKVSDHFQKDFSILDHCYPNSISRGAIPTTSSGNTRIIRIGIYRCQRIMKMLICHTCKGCKSCFYQYYHQPAYTLNLDSYLNVSTILSNIKSSSNHWTLSNLSQRSSSCKVSH